MALADASLLAMRLRLASYTFAASCADDLVILDGQSGSYLCVPDAPVQPVACGDEVIITEDQDLAAALAELRLLSASGSAAFPRRRPPPLTRERSRDQDLRFSCGEQWRGLVRVLVLSQRAYWRRPFVHLLRATAATAAWRRNDLAAAERTAALFRTVLPWAPFQGDCLYRSLVLRALLEKEAIAATFVIGVQTWPFEAHAWLQADDVVLDDSFDHVSGFTPLLAL